MGKVLEKIVIKVIKYFRRRCRNLKHHNGQAARHVRSAIFCGNFRVSYALIDNRPRLEMFMAFSGLSN